MTREEKYAQIANRLRVAIEKNDSRETIDCAFELRNFFETQGLSMLEIKEIISILGESKFSVMIKTVVAKLFAQPLGRKEG